MKSRAFQYNSDPDSQGQTNLDWTLLIGTSIEKSGFKRQNISFNPTAPTSVYRRTLFSYAERRENFIQYLI